MKKTVIIVQKTAGPLIREKVKSLVGLREAVRNIRRILGRRPVPVRVRYARSVPQPVPVLIKSR